MIPNMMIPQYRILPTDSTPTEATMAAVVTATLNAGAVPAIPMIADSKAPSDPDANFDSSNARLLDVMRFVSYACWQFKECI
jgi:hypothetical protein